MNCVILLLGLSFVSLVLAERPYEPSCKEQCKQETGANFEPCVDQCEQEKNARACREARVALDQLAAQGQNYWKVPSNTRSIGQRHFFGRRARVGRRILRLPPADRPIPPRPNQNGPATLPASLPESYSVRDEYGNQCPSVKQSFDQGGCGNCWAMSTASAINDRECIYRPAGSPIRYVSAPVLTACPLENDNGDNGCDGGWEDRAWDYWKSAGLPTGGETSIPQTPSGCQPFGTRFIFTESNQCKRTCDDNNAPGAATISKGAVTYGIANDETEIMKEIYLYGPVTAGFSVKRDFTACYNGKGIYKHVAGEAVSGHAVKIYGWGVENGTKYWLIQNSWGPTWGENGSFRFQRGTNEAGIEEGIFAGIPEVNDANPNLNPQPDNPDCQDDPNATGGFCQTALNWNYCTDPEFPIAAESCKKTCGLC